MSPSRERSTNMEDEPMYCLTSWCRVLTFLSALQPHCPECGEKGVETLD